MTIEQDYGIKRRASKQPVGTKVWEQIVERIDASQVGDDRLYDGPVHLATGHQVFAREDKIAMRTSTRVVGISKLFRAGSRHRYYAWQRDWSVSVHLGDRIALYGMRYDKGNSRAVRANGAHALERILRAKPEHRIAFLTEFQCRTGRRFILDTHPVLAWYTPNLAAGFAVDADEATVQKALREMEKKLPMAGFLSATQASDLRGFVAAMFGKRAVRKDFVKAVAAASPTMVLFAALFRGRVPADHIVDFLRDNSGLMSGPTRQGLSDGYRVQRKMLSALDPRSLSPLLRSGMIGEHEANLIADAERQFYADSTPFVGARVRTWQELHDLPQVYRRRARMEELRAERDRLAQVEIEHTDLARQLHGAAVGTYRLVCAEHGGQLVDWGIAMDNCIASYAQEAASGWGVYGGVYDGEVLVANFQIRDGALRQLLGKHNQPLPASLQQALIEHFEQHGIDTSTFRGRTIDQAA